jgi:hypothetical protein
MRYLKKDPHSPLLGAGLKYETVTDRPKIRARLLLEQKGFCAYSERFIKQTDEAHIEHFDPRLKETPDDGYYNWYATLPWFNSRKPKKIDPYLPILSPSDPNVAQRISYNREVGLFKEVDDADVEAKKLIKFLLLDRNEWYEDCQKHLQRVRKLRELCGDDELFMAELQSDWDNLSFASALEAEFGIDVAALVGS